MSEVKKILTQMKYKLFLICIFNLIIIGNNKLSSNNTKKIHILNNLSYKNAMLINLRREVFTNIKNLKSGIELINFKLYHYTVRKDDNFFTIMARSAMDMDTLASVNNLASVYSIYPGQKILIPNIRGIKYILKKPESLAYISKKYKISFAILKKYQMADGLFLPGIKLKPGEKNLFTGKAFIHPLPTGKLSSKYGIRIDPFTKKQTFHRGIDIAAPAGTHIKASASGIVVFSGKKGGYGKLIILKHSAGYYTYYGHLKKINVVLKANVVQGQQIGQVGATGRATGPHLHFELHRLGLSKSPLKAISHR